MPRSLVTGGTGFIGSHVVEALIAAGDQVLVLDDFSTGRSDNLSAVQGDKLSVVEMDICDSRISEEVERFKPESVFHLAAQANVRKSVEAPEFDAEKNVSGTANLLEACRKADVKEFIFSSTGGAIYGVQDYYPADEAHAIRPECPYGVSKRAAELYLEYFSRISKMRCISLRYSNVYGPRQNPKGEAGVVAIFCDRLLAGEPLVVNGDGEQTRDFVYVKDVVEANLLARNSSVKADFEMYNVGQAVETSVLDIVEALRLAWRETTPSGEAETKVAVEHGPERPGEQKRSVISANKIEKALGWRPRVGLEEGLLETVRSFRR